MYTGIERNCYIISLGVVGEQGVGRTSDLDPV